MAEMEKTMVVAVLYTNDKKEVCPHCKLERPALDFSMLDGLKRLLKVRCVFDPSSLSAVRFLIFRHRSIT